MELPTLWSLACFSDRTESLFTAACFALWVIDWTEKCRTEKDTKGVTCKIHTVLRSSGALWNRYTPTMSYKAQDRINTPNLKTVFFFSKLYNTKPTLSDLQQAQTCKHGALVLSVSLSVLVRPHTQEVSDDITRVLSDTSRFLTTLPWQLEEKVSFTFACECYC